MITRRTRLASLAFAAILGSPRGGFSAGLSIAADHDGRAFSRGRSNGHDCTHRVGADERIPGSAVVIENVTGAAGTIGTGRVARATPDGYTLCVGFLGTHVLNGAIYSFSTTS